MKRKKPFPEREYQALNMLSKATETMTALELQAAAGLNLARRNMARALERLRAFGHVAAELPKERPSGRPPWGYWITKKGKKRLKWLSEHTSNYKARK